MGHKAPIKQKEYLKAWYEAHKEELKIKREEYHKAWKKANKEYQKAWIEAHKEEVITYHKNWREVHKEKCKAYAKSYISNDLNSLGKTKQSIRCKSQYYLIKYGKKIPGYEIHHCFTYDEPYKFIYCSKELHRLIHAYLKQHNIDADTDHYEYIKHLLDDTVIKYNID